MIGVKGILLIGVRGCIADRSEQSTLIGEREKRGILLIGVMGYMLIGFRLADAGYLKNTCKYQQHQNPSAILPRTWRNRNSNGIPIYHKIISKRLQTYRKSYVSGVEPNVVWSIYYLAIIWRCLFENIIFSAKPSEKIRPRQKQQYSIFLRSVM